MMSTHGDLDMAGNLKDLLAETMPDWDVVDAPAARPLDNSERPLSRPDRVAHETDEVREKYLGVADNNAASPYAADADPHATLFRAKKKGTIDAEVNTKTFVVSNGKIVGSQG
jgi:hypothetical protein